MVAIHTFLQQDLKFFLNKFLQNYFKGNDVLNNKSPLTLIPIFISFKAFHRHIMNLGLKQVF